MTGVRARESWSAMHPYRREWVASQQVSCPVCGALCWWPARSRRPRDHRARAAVLSLLAEMFGVAALVRQGVGPADGRAHRCPPTWSPLTEVPAEGGGS